TLHHIAPLAGIAPPPKILNILSIAVQVHGKILLAGVGTNALARLTTDGYLDKTFGNGGVESVSGGSGYLAIAPDGRFVVAGTLSGAFSAARFLASAPQIGSFTASPNPVTAGGNVTLTASSITDTNPNSTITQVALYVDSNNDGILEPGTDTLLGYAAQTSPGVWTFTFTVNLAPGTYTLFTQAEDTYGAFGDPVLLALTVQ